MVESGAVGGIGYGYPSYAEIIRLHYVQLLSDIFLYLYIFSQRKISIVKLLPTLTNILVNFFFQNCVVTIL